MPERPSPPTSLRRAFPLSVRIVAAIVAGYLVAAVVSGVFLTARLRRLAEEERNSRLADTMELLAPVARDALADGGMAQIEAVARAAASIRDLRVTLIRPDGVVIAESERPLPLANHRDRPEVREAFDTGAASRVRESTTVGEAFLYVARRIDAPDGTALGVLRLSMPTAVRDEAAVKVALLVLGAFAAGLPAVALVAWIGARRIARPLEQMTAAATRMAAGDFQTLPRGVFDDEAGRLAEALRRMGEELRGMLETSESERAELGAILGSMVEGVVALDRDERVLRANRGAATVLDLEDVPSPGTPLTDIVRLPALSEVARRALRGDHVRDTDVEAPGGAGRVLHLSAAPIATAGGEVGGAVLVIRDVTELRRLERARLDFVANVSHELRTPVAAVMGALETVQDLGEGEDPEAARRLVATAFRNAQRLSHIVNDLLALSAIETEEARLERSPVPLLRSVRSAAGALATESEQRGVSVQVPASTQPEIHVLGHEGRLDLVWGNLIGNALKYTPEGGSVSVTARVDERRRMACVEVADTGTGIPPDALHRIFERFYRVDKARSRDRGGTGLGLAIVKHIVRAHRGRVEVESRLGEGSTFRVWLPLPPVPQPADESA